VEPDPDWQLTEVSGENLFFLEKHRKHTFSPLNFPQAIDFSERIKILDFR
jgi:hypothetical protein